MIFDYDNINWKNFNWSFVFDKFFQIFKIFQRALATLILSSILIRGIYVGWQTGTITGLIWWTGISILTTFVVGIIFLALDGVLYVTDKSSTWLTHKLDESRRVRRGIIFSFLAALIPVTIAIVYFYWDNLDYSVIVFLYFYFVLLVPAAVASAERVASTVKDKSDVNQQTKEISDNLRQHLKEIDGNTKLFLEEAIACFENELYRATVVLSWTGAVSLLYHHVVENHLEEFNDEATHRNPKWRKAKTKDDLARMRESDFLDILDTLSVIGKNVKQELQFCLKLRNACGHPNSLEVSQNRVASHLEILALNIFSKFGDSV